MDKRENMRHMVVDVDNISESTAKSEGRTKTKTVKGTRKVVFLSIMTSLAIILSIVESVIPMPAAIPGIKPGLANIAALAAIVFWGSGEALLIMLVRTIITSFFAGNIFILAFSITGGIMSILVMSLLYRKTRGAFSLTGISIAGSVMHNIGQISVASVIMKDSAVFSYLPVLMVSGVIMGIFTGMCTELLMKAFKGTGIKP